MMTNSDGPPIMRNRIDTHRGSNSSGGEEPMAAAAPAQATTAQSADRTREVINVRGYGAAMTASADTVITAIDARRPGLKIAKKNLLLFFAQGHHLAYADEPLFAEALYATDRGVALEAVPVGHPEALTEAQLGTISNVVVRYSSLSPADLRTLVQASQPWLTARKGPDKRIDPAGLTDWFRRPDEVDDSDDERPSLTEVAEAEAYFTSGGRR
jgi:uncharacterized phage-associated protein